MLNDQFGVASYDQVARRGLTSRRMASTIAEGWLVRPRRWLVVDNRWSSEDAETCWRRQLHMVVCSCPPRQRASAALFRRSAAALWGIDGTPFGTVELAVTRGQTRAEHLYRVRPLAPGDRMLLDGLPVTSVGRTLLDLGQVAGVDIMERAVEWALRKGHVTIEGLARVLSGLPYLRGTRALREVLARRPFGAPPTESDAETLFLQLARKIGLPEPRRQFPVPTGEGMFRLDFAWPSRGLAVEIDGAATHASREALRRDLRRQNSLVLALASGGWSLLRFTWDDIASDRYRDQVAANVREAWVLGLSRTVQEALWPVPLVGKEP